jgi:hypothetical protein
VIRFIADHQVVEGRQVAFIVEASSPDGRPLNLSAAPLPTGAKFTPQAADPTSSNLSRAIFDWTPTQVSAAPVALSNSESAGYSVVAIATNNPNVRLCALTVRSQQLFAPGTWEYQFDASFGNSGAVAVNGGTARLTAVLPVLNIVNGEIGFGALQAGESGRSVNAIVLRSKGLLSPAFFQAAVGFKWVFSVR